MTTHRPGTVLSPRRVGGPSTSPRHFMGVTSVPSSPPAVLRQPAILRTRPRSMASTAILISQGILSVACCWSTWDGVMLIVGGEDMQEQLGAAIDTGACLVLLTPLLVLAVRGGMLFVGKSRGYLGLGFALPPGVDEHAVLDLYLIGLAAGILGVCVPALELLGHWLGKALCSASGVWTFLVSVVVIPSVYFAAGVCLSELAPAEGFVPNTRPRGTMWALCVLGHAVFLWACFYSPNVHVAFGYLLGFVHVVRLLKLVFSVPTNGEDWFLRS